MNDVQIKIGFINIAHFVDHYILLIFPTVVITLQNEIGYSYSELIALSTACFLAFGLFSLPVGWLGDHWSRWKMIAIFFFGSAASLLAVAAAYNLVMTAIALFVLGVFAAIYHPIGVTMLLANSESRGRELARNGVFGNMGVAFAPGITAFIVSLFGWRAAFAIPAAICFVLGVAFVFLTHEKQWHPADRAKTAEVRMTRTATVIFFAVYLLLSLSGGLVFNTVTISIPKIIDEGIHGDFPLTWIGLISTVVLLFGGVAQLIVGRLVSHYPPHYIFAAIGIIQAIGTAWATVANGYVLIVALAISISATYAQVTVGDVVLARYTADSWRGRIYALRFFLIFTSSGLAVWMIAALYGRGGFSFVLGVTTILAIVFAICTVLIAILVSFVENDTDSMKSAQESN